MEVDSLRELLITQLIVRRGNLLEGWLLIVRAIKNVRPQHIAIIQNNFLMLVRRTIELDHKHLDISFMEACWSGPQTMFVVRNCFIQNDKRMDKLLLLNILNHGLDMLIWLCLYLHCVCIYVFVFRTGVCLSSTCFFVVHIVRGWI